MSTRGLALRWSFEEALTPTPRHEAALSWFSRHAQLELPWSALQTEGGDRVVTSAKGIYKPAWSEYALSISQRIGSTYDDDLIHLGEEGAGRSRYHQEGPTTADQPHPVYTNDGLLRCMQDAVPVGALVQVSRAPALYSVVGMARIVGWERGSFVLELGGQRPGSETLEGSALEIEAWQPGSDDTRERARAVVIRRRGQPAFRRALLRAYNGRCAATGTNAPAVLEAAHITPYTGPESDLLANGLLLRSDIHALFDLGLFAVNSADMTCLVAPSLVGTEYAGLAGAVLDVPLAPPDRPSIAALDTHREWSRL